MKITSSFFRSAALIALTLYTAGLMHAEVQNVRATNQNLLTAKLVKAGLEIFPDTPPVTINAAVTYPTEVYCPKGYNCTFSAPEFIISVF